MSFDPLQLVRPGYWLESPLGVGPLPIALAALFVVLIAASLAVWLLRRRLFPGQRIKTRLAAQLGPWFVGIAATGLFFVALRLVSSPILTTRLLWLLCLLAFVGLLGYVAWYMRTRYAVEMARLEREEMQRRFMPRRRERRRPSRRR